MTTVDINPWALQAMQDQREAEGVEIEWKYGWKFKIGRKGQWSKRYTDAVNRIFSRVDVMSFRRRVDAKNYTQTEADERFWRAIQAEVVVEGILIGWSGVVNSTGQPLEFNRHNALGLMVHFRELRSFLEDSSADDGLFAPEIEPSLEELAGN